MTTHRAPGGLPRRSPNGGTLAEALRWEATCRRIRRRAQRILDGLPVEDPEVVWLRRVELLADAAHVGPLTTDRTITIDQTIQRFAAEQARRHAQSLTEPPNTLPGPLGPQPPEKGAQNGTQPYPAQSDPKRTP